jgi:5-methylthioadenosine/S-adenosylhomocysteine deaminase
VDEHDIYIIASTDSKVAHCPKSNSKFGHGRAPFASFVKKGIAVGLGSDSVASNNTCDMLEEARFAVMMARASIEDIEKEGLLSADDALRAMTLGGARALGLDDQIGSLEVGKQADITVVGLDGAHQIPVHDPAAALVFSSSGRDVVMTMVTGKKVYSQGRVVTVDEESLRSRIEELRVRIAVG